jgi:hypothetical protein
MLRIEQVNSSATFVAQLFAADDRNPCDQYLLPKSSDSGSFHRVNLEFLRLFFFYLFSEPKGKDS